MVFTAVCWRLSSRLDTRGHYLSWHCTDDPFGLDQRVLATDLVVDGRPGLADFTLEADRLKQVPSPGQPRGLRPRCISKCRFTGRTAWPLVHCQLLGVDARGFACPGASYSDHGISSLRDLGRAIRAASHTPMAIQAAFQGDTAFCLACVKKAELNMAH